MVYATPPNQPPEVPLAVQVQQEQVSGNAPAEARLSDDGRQAIVRRATLRQLVDGSIKANETLGVLTGVQIVDLRTEHMLVNHNQDTEHFAASVNKLPVSLLLVRDIRRGTLDMDQQVSWEASDVRAGAGVYDQPGAPLSASLKDVIYDMLNRSGNTAVRVSVNQVLGGPDAVNARWKQIPQLSHTYLQPLDATHFYLGNSTPHDALWTLRTLLARQDSAARFIKDALATNIYTDYGVRSQLAGNEWVVLANKVGILDDVEGDNRHDVGISARTIRTATPL